MRDRFYIIFIIFIFFANVGISKEIESKQNLIPKVIVFDYDDTLTNKGICDAMCEQIKNIFSIDSNELKQVLSE